MLPSILSAARFHVLHDGAHDSATDLDAMEWALVAACVLALAGLAFVIWKLAHRRRGD